MSKFLHDADNDDGFRNTLGFSPKTAELKTGNTEVGKTLIVHHRQCQDF